MGYFTTLIDSKPMDSVLKGEIASIIGLKGRYADIWRDSSIFLVDNACLDESQKDYLYYLLSLIPDGLHNLRFITVRAFLGQCTPDILLSFSGALLTGEASAGVNILGTPITSPKNPFPSDSQPVLTPRFCAVAAHEINHIVDSVTIGGDRKLLERKYALIERAAGPAVIFFPPKRHLGVDWAATKTNFMAKGFWDGIDENWAEAWDEYWASGPGKTLSENWLRNILKMICKSPQEAFATLAHQYFTDTDIMLDLCMRRWNRGIKTCINQFLFFADVYSQGGDITYFYRTDASGRITRKAVPVDRDAKGRITGMLVSQTRYLFNYDVNDDVVTIGRAER